MSSAQDETFAPRNLAVLGGLLFFALFLGEAVFPRGGGIFSGPDASRQLDKDKVVDSAFEAFVVRG